MPLSTVCSWFVKKTHCQWVVFSLAANEHMTGGGGIDGVIHRAAGPKLLDECYLHRKVMAGVRLPTGRSRILFSYNLSKTTSYIINTAGPVYSSYDRVECAKQLSSCYETAMALANLYDLQTIAFPAISCGIFGYVSDDYCSNRFTSLSLVASRRRCRTSTAYSW